MAPAPTASSPTCWTGSRRRWPPGPGAPPATARCPPPSRPRWNRRCSPAHGAPTRSSHNVARAARCTGAAHIASGSRLSSHQRNAPSAPVYRNALVVASVEWDQGLLGCGGAPGSWPGGAGRDSAGPGSVGPCVGYGLVESGAVGSGAAESAGDGPGVVGYGGSQTVAPSGPVTVYGSPLWAAISR